MMLTENQKEIIGDRILAQLPRMKRGNIPEQKQFEMIGSIVDGAIDDFRPVYKDTVEKRVEPSILPKPDDATIGKMADWQRSLKRSGKTPAEQEEILDELYRNALLMQKFERS